mmetsp:Transcript_27949/g.68759  ORF Transcript_27949/g.68759 Transcript_27949/m.68759 type:complete len:103 (-) Transcript_27949:218-526(-)
MGGGAALGVSPLGVGGSTTAATTGTAPSLAADSKTPAVLGADAADAADAAEEEEEKEEKNERPLTAAEETSADQDGMDDEGELLAAMLEWEEEQAAAAAAGS